MAEWRLHRATIVSAEAPTPAPLILDFAIALSWFECNLSWNKTRGERLQMQELDSSDIDFFLDFFYELSEE